MYLVFTENVPLVEFMYLVFTEDVPLVEFMYLVFTEDVPLVEFMYLVSCIYRGYIYLWWSLRTLYL